MFGVLRYGCPAQLRQSHRWSSVMIKMMLGCRGCTPRQAANAAVTPAAVVPRNSRLFMLRIIAPNLRRAFGVLARGRKTDSRSGSMKHVFAGGLVLLLA